jgi:hypothetical protein
MFPTICPIQAPAILSFNSVFEIFCAEINKMLVIKTSKKMIGFFILIRVDLLEGTLFYVNLVDEMSKCYYCSLWVMNYGAGGLVAREKRKHLMVV